jgi:DNA-binding GntR family transcriptional regulator
MSSDDISDLEEQPLHSTVYRLVKQNIASGTLAAGTAITEYRVAQELSVSREPVGRALQRLEDENLLVRDGARGYVVAGAPRVKDRAMPSLDITEEVLDLIRGRTEWQKIWDRVQADLVACMPFGRYKVVEMTMASHYGVSRTVTRDLLARLETLGIVEREGRSQCFLRQLTHELMNELYEVRCLLEPAALIGAAPFLSTDVLEAARQDLLDAEKRYPDITAEDLARYETALHIHATEPCPNRSLIGLVRQSQMLVLATNRLMPLYLGMPKIEPFLLEHRLVIELLLNGAHEAAGLALKSHLLAAVRKQHSRLEQLASYKPIVPPYLTR